LKQEIRIIGGLYRGKKLQFPVQEGLRPTPDRVRETLFNWLMPYIRGAHCLDAFAGSGALGFEAYSRGAASVLFLEYATPVLAQLKKSIALFPAVGLDVLQIDSREYLLKANKKFDLIFLDPPFAQNYLEDCIQVIAQRNLLNIGGFLYTESAQPLMLAPEFWHPHRAKKAGQVHYALWQLNHSD